MAAARSLYTVDLPNFDDFCTPPYDDSLSLYHLFSANCWVVENSKQCSFLNHDLLVYEWEGSSHLFCLFVFWYLVTCKLGKLVLILLFYTLYTQYLVSITMI